MLNDLKRVVGAKTVRLALMVVVAATLVTAAFAAGPQATFYSCPVGGAIFQDVYCDCGAGGCLTGTYDCSSMQCSGWLFQNCWLTVFGCNYCPPLAD